MARTRHLASVVGRRATTSGEWSPGLGRSTAKFGQPHPAVAGMGTAQRHSMLESDVSKQPAPNLGDLVEDALHQAKTLVQAELSLARAELKGELRQVLGSVLLFGVGAMFLQAALVTLGVFLVLALGVRGEALLVVLGLMAIAAVFLVLGVRSAELKLPRTTERLSKDAKQVLETVK